MVLDGRLAPSSINVQPPGIEFPAMSVNRGKYSEPGDVRLANWRDENWERWGVAQFMVGDVSSEPTEEIAAKLQHCWTWSVAHVPEEENFAHSEVRTSKDGEYRAAKPPDVVKKWFRMELSKRTRVIIEPEI
ncbi:MAG: hypothetical protein WD768_05830 [Phycisphaeraceae bacterium]